jgi:hypothetical protein
MGIDDPFFLVTIDAHTDLQSWGLRLNFRKEINELNLNDLDETAEYLQRIDFMSFANGVLEAYREAYGALKEVPVSFRETIYRNDERSIGFYPTGSAGIFDVFINYKEK